MFARVRQVLRLATWRAVPFLLVVALALMSGSRYGYATKPVQCPTAAVQQIAVTEHRADGSSVIVFRAPQPGEKGFVCCHCGEKRSAQQTGWAFTPNAIGILTEPALVAFPLLADDLNVSSREASFAEPPLTVITHPPTA